MYGFEPCFSICTPHDIFSGKVNPTGNSVFIDEAEIVFTDVLKMLGMSIDTAVMTIPSTNTFKDKD